MAPDDRVVLEQLARRSALPFFQVQRARILLAVAQGEPIQALAARLQCDRITVWRLCRRYEQSGFSGLLENPHRSGCPERISPPQRARIIQRACLEPVAKGLHITHWSSADLARQAVAKGIIDAISPRAVRRILHEVDLQPQRTRCWKTARLNAEISRATLARNRPATAALL